MLQKFLDSLIDRLGLVYIRPMGRILDDDLGSVWNARRHVVCAVHERCIARTDNDQGGHTNIRQAIDYPGINLR